MAGKMKSIEKIREYVENNSNCKLLTKERKEKGEKMLFLCECGKTFERTMRSFKQSKFKVCTSCSNKKSSSNRLNIDYVKKITNTVSESILLEEEYINNSHKMKFKCKCGNIFYTSWTEFYDAKKRKCNDCSGIYNYSINDIRDYVEKNSTSKLISKKYINNREKLKFLCDCGNIYETTFKKFKVQHQRCCKNCSKSRSSYEIYVESILKKMNLQYETQFKFKECKNKKELPFDFYIPIYNLVIEVDGEQHYIPYRFEKNLNDFADRVYNDAIKNSFCQDNNINILRIPYFNIDNSKKIILDKIKTIC